MFLHEPIVTPLPDVIEKVQEANRPPSPVPGSEEWSFVEQPLDIVRVIYFCEVKQHFNVMVQFVKFEGGPSKYFAGCSWRRNWVFHICKLLFSLLYFFY